MPDAMSSTLVALLLAKQEEQDAEQDRGRAGEAQPELAWICSRRRIGIQIWIAPVTIAAVIRAADPRREAGQGQCDEAGKHRQTPSTIWACPALRATQASDPRPQARDPSISAHAEERDEDGEAPRRRDEREHTEGDRQHPAR